MIITIGTTVHDGNGNQYILDEILGSGGFGNVYKAHCENNGKVVAIKMLQNAFDSNDSYLSFQREANQAKLIDSENVIKYLYIHDGKTFPEFSPYIIMEYTDGGTLREYINRQNGSQIEQSVLKQIYLQLAHGMKCISEHLVHRDIKPENILLFGNQLKITDFGLSKIAGDSTKTMTFKNAGTPLYIAPEAWNNDSNTIQMDIYSMGIVFYELATLSYPYEIPMGADIFSLKNIHLFNAVKNPSSIRKDLSPAISSMIIKMLEKPTQSRFRNWDEIISALESESLPADDLSAFVNKAITLKNKKDLQRQQEYNERQKAIQEKEEHINFVYSQFKNTILSLVREFSDRVNAQCFGNQKIVEKESEPSMFPPRFSTVLSMPSGNRISISGEILFAENFTKTVRFFFDREEKQVNYHPQCNGKDVLLWCQVNDQNDIGFNLLLLKNENSIYGDWFILENTVNAISKQQRPSPFGFTLSELPKEINHINVLHVYVLSLVPFSKEKLLSYLSERV